jgi:transposase-like protein
MTTNFKNLLELNDYFKEEKTCYEFLAAQIWDGGKAVCPHCSSVKVYTTKSRSTKLSKKDVPEYRCANKECAKKFTATVGTIFQASKIPLRTWFASIFLITTSKKGISSLQLAAQLGITQKTAWFINHRIREMFKETAPEMLKGIVEADECYIGGKNYNRHANKKRNYEVDGDEKIPVVGLVERGGNIKTFVVPNATQALIHPIMVEHVANGTTLITDHHKSYLGLSTHINHVRVKGDTLSGDYKTDRHFHTNNIENFWSTLKRGIIGIYHYVSPQHLHRYTTEFTYRYNNRKDLPVAKFNEAVAKANNTTLSYKKLTGK